MKKIFSLLLAFALVLSLAACGGGGSTPPAADGGTTPPADANEPAPADVTITVAALASGYEEAYPGMWQEVCDAFTAETGVKVNLICDKNLEDVIGPPAVRRASPSSSSRTATSPRSPTCSA